MGIDIVEDVPVNATGTEGLKVSKVYPRTAAEKTGLHAGDVILSINGYFTTKSSVLDWVIADASTSKVLRMSVRTAADGKVHTLTAQLP